MPLFLWVLGLFILFTCITAMDITILKPAHNPTPDLTFPANQTIKFQWERKHADPMEWSFHVRNDQFNVIIGGPVYAREEGLSKDSQEFVLDPNLHGSMFQIVAVDNELGGEIGWTEYFSIAKGVLPPTNLTSTEPQPTLPGEGTQPFGPNSTTVTSKTTETPTVHTSSNSNSNDSTQPSNSLPTTQTQLDPTTPSPTIGTGSETPTSDSNSLLNSNSKSSKSPLAIIIGSTLGGVVFLLLIAFIMFLKIRKRRKRRSELRMKQIVFRGELMVKRRSTDAVSDRSASDGSVVSHGGIPKDVFNHDGHGGVGEAGSDVEKGTGVGIAVTTSGEGMKEIQR